MALGLSSPLPCPQTARPSGCKGARNAREPATNPCSATGASGIHPPPLRFAREVGQSRREREIRPRSRGDRRAKYPDICTDSPLGKARRFPPLS